MFQQNGNKWIFVCVLISQNIIPLFHKKVTFYDPLQKSYPNLAKTCKNKFYENEIKLNWLNILKKIYYGITDKGRGQKALPPCQIELTAIKLLNSYMICFSLYCSGILFLISFQIFLCHFLNFINSSILTNTQLFLKNFFRNVS